MQGDDRAGGTGEPETTKHQQQLLTGHKSDLCTSISLKHPLAVSIDRRRPSFGALVDVPRRLLSVP
jgi:hypothetical protein